MLFLETWLILTTMCLNPAAMTLTETMETNDLTVWLQTGALQCFSGKAEKT